MVRQVYNKIKKVKKIKYENKKYMNVHLKDGFGV